MKLLFDYLNNLNLYLVVKINEKSILSIIDH